MDKYSFQNCQKIVLFNSDNTQVLLAKRSSEADYDGIYSFIGGKMEKTDVSLIEGIRREKNEEIGTDAKIILYPVYNTLFYYVKKDGSCMILPHYYAKYVDGNIKLNEEYSEYKWVPIKELEIFEPKIQDIPQHVERLLALLPLMTEKDFVEM